MVIKGYYKTAFDLFGDLRSKIYIRPQYAKGVHNYEKMVRKSSCRFSQFLLHVIHQNQVFLVYKGCALYISAPYTKKITVVFLFIIRNILNILFTYLQFGKHSFTTRLHLSLETMEVGKLFGKLKLKHRILWC